MYEIFKCAKLSCREKQESMHKNWVEYDRNFFRNSCNLLSKNNEKIRQKTARPGKIQSVFWRFLSLLREFQKFFAVILYPIFIHIPQGKNTYMFLYVQNIHVVHLSKYKFFSGLIFFKVSQNFCIFYTYVMYVFFKKNTAISV